MIRIVTCLLCLFSTMLCAEISQIKITPPTDAATKATIHFVSPFKTSNARLIEMQDEISNATLDIIAHQNDKLRASLQLETSMSIQDEGPHLDLLDWKHCTSDWLTLNHTAAQQFQLPDFDNIMPNCFPDVTISEIKQAVLEHDGQEWMPLFDRDSFSKEMNLLIGISAASIKVEQLIAGKWEVVTILTFNIPIGC